MQFAMLNYTNMMSPSARELLRYANKAGAAFTAQTRRARDQPVASHWTDSPLFDWHLVHEITQYIEYPIVYSDE
jgi:hypothetical protein